MFSIVQHDASKLEQWWMTRHTLGRLQIPGFVTLYHTNPGPRDRNVEILKSISTFPNSTKRRSLPYQILLSKVKWKHRNGKTLIQRSDATIDTMLPHGQTQKVLNLIPLLDRVFVSHNQTII